VRRAVPASRSNQGAIFAEVNDRIMRYNRGDERDRSLGKGEVIVSGLPIRGIIPSHPFIIDAKGNLFVDVGTATNACEEKNRVPNSPGRQPCTEKETRGGTWRYDANKTNQKFSAADRYASGIRNGEGFAIDADGRLFVTQHGRDQLAEDWQQFYKGQIGSDLSQPKKSFDSNKAMTTAGRNAISTASSRSWFLHLSMAATAARRVGMCATRTPPVSFSQRTGHLMIS